MSNRDFWKEWNRGKHYGVGAQKIVDSVEQEQMPRELWEALREYKEYYRGLGFVEGITFTPKEDK